ncbi:MAG: HDIG domain-containing protein [Candidatus Caenarcaniphilales bacterium]|nr:HDIG domain-containing protein [Candidatus Caenarcaniphilales bacterium]
MQAQIKFISRIIVIILLSLVCSFLLWYQRILPPAFRLGARSPVKVVIPKSSQVEDYKATEALREKARETSLKDYFQDPILRRNDRDNYRSLNKLRQTIDLLDSFFTFREGHLRHSYISPKAKCMLVAMNENELDQFWQQHAESSRNSEWQSIFEEIDKDKTHIQDIKREITELRNRWDKCHTFGDELPEIVHKVKLSEISLASWNQLKPLLLPTGELILKEGYLGFMHESTIAAYLRRIKNGELGLIEKNELQLANVIFHTAFKPNIIIELDSLDRIEESAVKSIKPIYKQMKASTVLLKKGQIIDREAYSVIQQLNLNRKEIDKQIFREAFGLTLLIFLSFWFYIRLEKLHLTGRQMTLLCFLIILASAYIGIYAFRYTEAMPLTAVALITGLFFRPSVGFAAGALFSILTLKALELEPIVLLPSFIGIVIGTIFSRRAKNRSDLAQAGIWLAIGQMTGYIIETYLSPIQHFDPFGLIWQGIAGIATALLVAGGMPYLESLFSVVTRFRLLELADPSQPLLQKLHDLTPGTYEHTLVVADLAMEASRRLHLDYELVRVGVLYHDIGKMYNPKIFIENQFGEENPHEKLTPLESAKAVIEHIPQGLELARKYGLPEPIQIFIPTHQGTARAGHFYLKARQLDPELNDDSEFRYPGPKPISRETGIVMLADTVEATLRSLKTDDKDLVKQTIHNLIDARVHDSQLSESGLTDNDLNIIADSFFMSWKNKNHERIKYISDLAAAQPQ